MIWGTMNIFKYYIFLQYFMASLQDLYFGGDMEAAIPLSGQVCGRIDEVLSAEDVVRGTMEEFHRTMQNLARTYVS